MKRGNASAAGKDFWRIVLRWYLLILLLVFSSSITEAQQNNDPPGIVINRNCATGEIVHYRLANRFGEALELTRTMRNGFIGQLWANDVTGTWTITITLIDRIPHVTCIVGAGDDHVHMAERPV